MQTMWLEGAEWMAVLRIGLGLWWLESWRHKDKKSWFAGGGISWAATCSASATTPPTSSTYPHPPTTPPSTPTPKRPHSLHRNASLFFRLIRDVVQATGNRAQWRPHLAARVRQVLARGDPELACVLAAELARALVADLIGCGGDRGATRLQELPCLEQAKLLLVLQRRR
jgi:hypothetical protein